MRIFALVGMVLSGALTALFALATLGLMASGEIGSAVLSLVLTVGAGFLARRCLRWFRNATVGAQAGPVAHGPAAPRGVRPAPPEPSAPSAITTTSAARPHQTPVLQEPVGLEEKRPAAPPSPPNPMASTADAASLGSDRRTSSVTAEEPSRARKPRRRGPSGVRRVKLTRAGHGRPAVDQTFVAVDLETTGLEPGVDHAVEIGAVKFRGDGTVLDEFATLISGPPSSPEARDCHGIEEKDRDGAPAGAEAWSELFDFVQGSIMVAHNADFEQPFMEAASRRYKLRMPDLPVVCTLQEARRHFDGRAFSLKALHRHATGEWRDDTHQALGDARATKDVLLWMIRTSPQPLLVTGEEPRSAEPTGLTCTMMCRPAPLREPSVSALLQALPQSHTDRAGEAGQIATYIELLSEVLHDGRLTYQEVTALAKQAVRTGLTGPQIKRLHHEAFQVAYTGADPADAPPSQLNQMALTADALGLEELADEVRLHVPPQQAATPPQPRLLRGRRYAFLGESADLVLLKEKALANGAPEVKNVTKTVIWAAADDPNAEGKQHTSARTLGIPLISPSEAEARLDEDIASAEQKRFVREQQIAAQEAEMERWRAEAARRQEEQDAFWRPSWRTREHPEDPGPPEW